MSAQLEERPDPLALLRELASEGRRRAILRVYLGYAPGCGTSTSMLDEARRRAGRGSDVVVASYRIHGPPAEALASLEVVDGSRSLAAERALNVESVLARNPDVGRSHALTWGDVNSRPPRD